MAFSVVTQILRCFHHPEQTTRSVLQMKEESGWKPVLAVTRPVFTRCQEQLPNLKTLSHQPVHKTARTDGEGSERQEVVGKEKQAEVGVSGVGATHAPRQDRVSEQILRHALRRESPKIERSPDGLQLIGAGMLARHRPATAKTLPACETDFR